MNVGSLFSGIGGIEIGFETEGFRTEWFVEYDSYCQAILKKRFPNTPIYGDITKTDFRAIPKVDILTGGFPCQDISNAGKRVGITGSRSALWKYYLEAIRILRPKYAVIENVSALVSRGLDVVLADLAQVGYDAEWYNISASSIGAPHRRERIFIICYSEHIGWDATQKQRSIDEGSDDSKTGKIKTCKSTRPSDQYDALAHSDGSRHIHSESKDITAEGGEYAQRELEPSSKNVEDTECNRRNEGNREEEFRKQKREQHSHYIEGTSWWSVEPELGRVAHGIPNRVDRIKCLGNAVVPQVAQVFAQAIKEYEKARGEWQE